MAKVKMTAAGHGTVSHNSLKPSRTWLLFLLLILMVPLFAVTVITNHGPKMQQQALNKLSAIADLKASQIENWLHEQDNVAKVIASNNILFNHTKRLINGDKPTEQKMVIAELFSAFQRLYKYDSIILLSVDKEVLFQTGELHPSSLETQRVQDKSLTLQTIEHTGIITNHKHPAHLDFIIPLIDQSGMESTVIALVMIHIDPNQFIFPYLQHWPTPSKSGESFLVRNNNGKIEHLTSFTDLPAEKKTHLKRHSITEQDLPAAIALQSQKPGTMIGKDYRGTEVLAAYHPVEGTDWMLISKLDLDEATQSLHDLIFWLSLIALLSIVIIGIAFVIVLQKQRQTQRLELLAEKSQNEHILQHFYELPFIGMAILEPDHERWIRFNPHLAEILNYTPDELAQHKLSDIVDPKDHLSLQEKFSLITEQSLDGFTQEVHLQCKDDCPLFGVIDVKCIRNDDGSIQFFLATIQDVTEFTHLTEQNLAHQNQLLTLLHTIPDLVWLKDVNGVYLNCNTRFETFFGAKESEIVGKTDYDFVDKELADFFREHDLNAMKQDKPTENEEWLTFSDTGYKGLFSTVKTPVKDSAGNVIGVLGVARDITKRKEAELQLERLTLLYSAMSQINEAIVRCSNEDELFNKICEVAVQYGGMKMAWVGIVDKKTQKIHAKAYFGEHSDYLEDLEISTDENERSGQGPTGIAFRENHPYWCQDFLNDPRTAAWHERGSQAGWRSSAAVPLHQNNKVIGTLNLYSDTLNAFDAPARDLLIEMTTDIGFALNSFSHEEVRQKAEAAKQEAFDRMNKLAERLPGVVYQYRLTPDGNSCFPFASDAIYDIYRVHPDEVREDASKVFEALHPDDLQKVADSIQKSAQNLTPWHQEYRVKFKDGNVRWLSGNAMPEKEQDGSTLWHGFISDITEHKKTEAQIELASKVFEQSREGIMITDPDKTILLVNQAFTEISGYSADEVLGKTPGFLASGKHSDQFYDNMWDKVNTQGHWQGEVWNRRKDGEVFPEWLTISRGLDNQGNVTEYIGMFTDISKVKESEEKIQHLAHYDPLTNLANRQLLMDRLQHAISESKRHDSPLSLLFVDLDHFKNVNDTLGHHIGDELLIEISKRMSTLLRAEDTLSRQGGDEFIIVLPGTGEDGAAHVAEKILRSVSTQIQVESYELFITPSVGIAVFPQDGDDIHTLLKNADAAMYEAKQDGRNAYRFFTEEMQAHSSRLMQIESALRMALIRNEFQLNYQPQICAETGQIIGAEALIRWHHPELGTISPMEFIPVAEQSGQILGIGQWVLRTALQQLKTWIGQGHQPFVMAVNLSAVQFRQKELPDQVMHILSETGVEPKHLELELTESVAMSDPEAAIEMINKLGTHGIKIAIDDFGTGYSSLSYLKRFNATKLKIDQSFVRDLTIDAEDRAIVKAIISLAQNLGLMTIAEGVETAEQLAFLKQEKCEEIQGYYFSKPLTAEDFEQFLLDNNMKDELKD